MDKLFHQYTDDKFVKKAKIPAIVKHTNHLTVTLSLFRPVNEWMTNVYMSCIITLYVQLIK